MEKIIYSVSFLLSSSNYVVNLSIPLYLISKFSASPLILGLAGFFGNFAYTTFTFLFYRFRWGIHFPWFIISSILISGVYLLLPFVHNYFFFFFLIFLNGIFYSRFWPSIQYFFAEEVENVNKYNLSWSFGVIFGTFISGYLFKIKEIMPFLTGSFFAFFGFLLGRINFKKFLEIYKNLPEKFTINNEIDRETEKIFVLNFINFFAIGGILFLYPKLAKTIGFSSALISNILSSLFIVRFFMFYIFSRVNVRVNQNILFFSYFLIFLSYFLTGIFKNPLFHAIFISILGITSAFSYKTTLFTVIKRGYSTEMNESIIGVGLFTGPLITGFLSQIFGIFNGFIISGFLVLFAFLLQRYLLK